MNFFNYLVSAGKGVAKAPFEKREGQPWLQGVNRNYRHAILGDEKAVEIEHKYLGDTEDGRRYAGDNTPPASTSVLPPVTQPLPQQQTPQNGQQMDQIMKALMQRIAQGQQQPQQTLK